MLHNHASAVAGGHEAPELIRILTSQPDGPLRNQLLKTIQQEETIRSLSWDVIEEEVALLARGAPAFIRPPKPGERCPHTGLSRTGLMELITPCSRNDHQPPVKAILKRSHPLAKRGVWYVPARNLFRYLLMQGECSRENFLAMREARKKAD